VPLARHHRGKGALRATARLLADSAKSHASRWGNRLPLPSRMGRAGVRISRDAWVQGVLTKSRPLGKIVPALALAWGEC